MSPLPSPEERRKRLQTLTLDEVLGRGHRGGAQGQAGTAEGRRRSPAAEERERQRREAAVRRSKAPSFN